MSRKIKKKDVEKDVINIPCDLFEFEEYVNDEDHDNERTNVNTKCYWQY